MANYWTIFDEYPTGVQPTGWTQRYTASTWTVEVGDSSNASAKRLHHSSSSGTALRLLSMDAVDGDAARADVEVFGKFRTGSSANFQGLAAVRGAGAVGATLRAYHLTITANASSLPTLSIVRHTGNTNSTLASGSVIHSTSSPFESNVWFNFRFRVVGNTLRAKAWAHTFEEPAEWALVATDSMIADAGWVGAAAYNTNGPGQWGFFAVATGGDTAFVDRYENARVTQAAVQVLDQSDSAVRVTHVFAYALETQEMNVRATQTVVLALTAGAPCITQRCQCWKITREDGLVFAYTTHDEPVTYQGVTYLPCDSLTASATSSGEISGGTVGDSEVQGVLAADAITEFDLLSGKFDNAAVEVWVVGWGTLDRAFTPYRILKGSLGLVSAGQAGFKAELLSTGARLAQRPLLTVVSPLCRFDLGSGGCPVNVAAMQAEGFVTAVEDRNTGIRATYRRFFDTQRAGDPAGYWEFGRLTWTSGPNTGVTSEVKSSADGTGLITLWQPMPHEIAPGHTYTIRPGCNKTVDHHRNKFGLTMERYGGFPDVPGMDAIMETPNAKG